MNVRASETLVGRIREKFEFADLEFKWLAFPKLIGKDGFDPGAEPFQSFVKLIKFRNGLVRYKKHKEQWQHPGVPSFLGKLGPTIEDSSDSVKCVRRMLTM